MTLWHRGADPRVPRCLLVLCATVSLIVAVAAEGRVYAIGGYGSPGYLSVALAANATTNYTWFNITAVPVAGEKTGAFVNGEPDAAPLH